MAAVASLNALLAEANALAIASEAEVRRLAAESERYRVLFKEHERAIAEAGSVERAQSVVAKLRKAYRTLVKYAGAVGPAARHAAVVRYGLRRAILRRACGVALCLRNNLSKGCAWLMRKNAYVKE